MKQKSCVILMLGLALLILSTSFRSDKNEKDKVLGKWMLPEGLELEVYKSGNTYQGKIVKLHDYNNGQTRDVHNPDNQKKQELLVGKIILENLVYDIETHQWIEGTIYNPGKGITANLEVIEIYHDKLIAVGSKLLFSKRVEWKKVKN